MALVHLTSGFFFLVGALFLCYDTFENSLLFLSELKLERDI